MAAIGPLLGGWLTTNASWRWAFLINLPIAAVAVIGTLAYINESRDEHAQRRFDVRGALLTMIGFGALVFGLIEGYKYYPLPKLEIYRAANGKPPLYPEDEHIVALATDVALQCPLPQFGLEDYDAIAAFVLATLEPKS